MILLEVCRFGDGRERLGCELRVIEQGHDGVFVVATCLLGHERLRLLAKMLLLVCRLLLLLVCRLLLLVVRHLWHLGLLGLLGLLLALRLGILEICIARGCLRGRRLGHLLLWLLLHLLGLEWIVLVSE